MVMSSDRDLMLRALALARRGEGHVEPNPMVGSIVLDSRRKVVGEGWHVRFGGPHAEVQALAAAGDAAHGGTLYVTLEPCCHQGKTPPCTRAIREAGIARVVAATRDPFTEVDGSGFGELRAAGIECAVGVAEQEALELLAPYLMLVTAGRPWVIGKWAMTLDGKIATPIGDSQWISGEESRAIVHKLRGRVDAIMVGARTAERDNPRLTARPPGPRSATRIVMGSIAADSRLVQTIDDAPLLVVADKPSSEARLAPVVDRGAEVLWLPEQCRGDRSAQMEFVLAELAQRRMTNLLVEGGGELLGTLKDLNAIDEAHVFVAPKLIGGRGSISPVAGDGIERIADALHVDGGQWQPAGADLYFSGRVTRG